jgi:hypothetical protein
MLLPRRFLDVIRKLREQHLDVFIRFNIYSPDNFYNQNTPNNPARLLIQASPVKADKEPAGKSSSALGRLFENSR